MAAPALAAAILASIAAPSSAFLLAPTHPLHSISRSSALAPASPLSVQARLAVGGSGAWRPRRGSGSVLGIRSQAQDGAGGARETGATGGLASGVQHLWFLCVLPLLSLGFPPLVEAAASATAAPEDKRALIIALLILKRVYLYAMAVSIVDMAAKRSTSAPADFGARLRALNQEILGGLLPSKQMDEIQSGAVAQEAYAELDKVGGAKFALVLPLVLGGSLLTSFFLLNSGLSLPTPPTDSSGGDFIKDLAAQLKGVVPLMITTSNAAVSLLFTRVEVDAALQGLGWRSDAEKDVETRQKAALGLAAAAVAGSYLGPAALVWPLRNAVNMCVAVTAARAIQLPRLPWATALLASLVAYDVVGVFGSGVLIPAASAAVPLAPPPTSVMEGVARARLGGAAGSWQPGLLTIFLQGRPTDALGLGDAVFPAVLSGWALRWDKLKEENGSKSFLFQAALAGYCGGCFLCEVFNSGAGQPALLFLSPAMLLAVFSAAAVSGDLVPAWQWAPSTQDDGSSGDETGRGGEGGQGDGGGAESGGLGGAAEDGDAAER